MADDKYDWEDFTLKSVPVPDAPFVSLQKLGTFSLNRAARELLGDPETQLFVRLRYDRAKQTIGMTVVPKDTPAAYPVRSQKSHGATWIVAGAAFCKHFGIPIGKTRRYMAKAAPGPTLIVDLKHDIASAVSRGQINGRLGEQ